MEITRSTVPGAGVLHQLITRDGQRFAVLVTRDRQLFVYDGADEPYQVIALEPDEADQVAQLLQSRSIPDRLATVERLVDQLIREDRCR
ncbi:hypothetical protein FOS14_00605 [Skermania sp. ID1734]|uniref:hypothetical protein n=1 Tax=Skermania sp. ID1734 TaxID=2597516 RepID=UPI00117FC8AD|nr:hypothetical protein [Skermania sp. ID1734]TSE01932.1 hypothetical protein FOS14_00605 [Skermania sp. ID1734]